MLAKVVRVLKGAHKGSVADICVMEDGSFVSGGASDGALCAFDSDYGPIGMYLNFLKDANIPE